MKEKKYSKDFIKRANKLKDATLNFTDKVNTQKDARTEFGILYDTIFSNWKVLDTTLFAEEPSEWERQIDAAIEQSCRI